MAIRAQETAYHVRDLDMAIEFYTQKLGYRLVEHYEWGFALLDVDGVGGRIGLFVSGLLDPGSDVTRIHVPMQVLQTDDLDAEVERLASRGVQMTSATGTLGSTRAIRFYDPDGNPFFLWEDGSGTLPPAASLT